MGSRQKIIEGKIGLKARIVAQQINTGSYADAFAATPSMMAIRLLLLIALMYDLEYSLEMLQQPFFTRARG